MSKWRFREVKSNSATVTKLVSGRAGVRPPSPPEQCLSHRSYSGDSESSVPRSSDPLTVFRYRCPLVPAKPYLCLFVGAAGASFACTSGKLEVSEYICLLGDSPSVQFSSVAQSCPTLCNPMNRSKPGLPVHHHLPEFTQTHVN